MTKWTRTGDIHQWDCRHVESGAMPRGPEVHDELERGLVCNLLVYELINDGLNHFQMTNYCSACNVVP